MIFRSTIPSRSRRCLGLVLAAASMTLIAAGAAKAGQCPSHAVTANGQKPGASAHKHVTDKVLTMIPLSKEKVALKDHQFRLRRLVIQPGGEVAWHSHTERPAIIYVVSGAIVEYSSGCAVPITHKAGEATAESHVSHWWKNHTKRPVVLLSADILHEKDDPHTM